MKILGITAGIILILLSTMCDNNSQNENEMEITGNVEAIQMSSWQYGTHTLSNDNNFYALKSEKIDLSSYEGKTVTVKANRIEGYPVDGGPEFLEVTEVKEN